MRKFIFTNGVLTEMAASEFGKSLRFNNVCHELHISNCKIPDKAIHGLLKYFEDNETVNSLVIKKTALSDNSGGAFANLLLTDSKIKSLDISGNCFKDIGQNAVVCGLKANFRITFVSLEGNEPPLSKENAQRIQDLLGRNKAVQECIDLIIDKATNFRAVQDYRLDRPSDGPYIVVQKGTDDGKNGTPYKISWGKRSDAEKDFNHSVGDEQDCLPQCFGGVIADKKFNYGLADTIGRRQTMEDEILIDVKFNNCKNEHVFGVFDGHGGLQCSRFVSGVFSECLLKYRKKHENDPRKILEETFAEVDQLCKT